MTVLRIVANISTSSINEVRSFYAKLFSMTVGMDHGWIVTLMSGQSAETQISIAEEGGSVTPVPDFSIEVSNVDETFERATANNFPIVYGLTDEPWGVRRFYVRDPAGKIVNILSYKGVSVHSQQRLNSIARQLNESPRKTLGYESSAERFNQCVASTD
ncbi:glyoxalase [Providencia rettgeri]|uniref:Glyoxalase n=1 Tax=Providencia rettgeri TaxID=587 RepID=A0AAP2NU28_PRORE|nr:glyoxalase [Providencia rettgeri]MBX6954600.1 glyoxalase [Providencia rettgeri]MBX6959900.1 glyoxalase [Providencia rettgeri]MBX6972240.1 glyoxalase [Providencia rettgeri]MBX6978751.1 glyoxalase [Providencia rettgeri]